MDSVSVRLSGAGDRDEILSFVRRMGFNARDAVTWDGLHMVAMTAWEGSRLVGAIPMEPRVLQLGGGRVVRCMHETVVAVDEACRGGGIGSRLQEAIARERPGGAEIVTVFREDPASRAYRWYAKNGFEPLVRVRTWAHDRPGDFAAGAYDIYGVGDDRLDWGVVEAARQRSLIANVGGVVERRTRPLREWLAVHPYRNRYQFWVVSDGRGSYALLGVGTLHSSTVRAEVLELIVGESAAAEGLLRAVAGACAGRGWPTVRVPLAEGDGVGRVVVGMGFEVQWEFHMMGRWLASGRETAGGWGYAGVDFI